MAANQENYQLYKRYIKNIALVYQRRKDVRAYIELLLSLAVIVIFSIFAIRPTIITVLELTQEITEKEQTVASLQQKIDNLDTAQNLVNQNRRTLALLDSAVPNGPLPESYTRQIEGLAQKNTVNILGITSARVSLTTVSTPESTDVTQGFVINPQTVEVSLDVSGDFVSVLSFLSDFEKMRRPMSLSSMNFRVLDEETISSDVVLSLSGLIPYIP